MKSYVYRTTQLNKTFESIAIDIAKSTQDWVLTCFAMVSYHGLKEEIIPAN